MPEYEIRLHKADGTLSIVMKTHARDDSDAKAKATDMIKGDIIYARILSGEEEIAVVPEV